MVRLDSTQTESARVDGRAALVLLKEADPPGTLVGARDWWEKAAAGGDTTHWEALRVLQDVAG